MKNNRLGELQQQGQYWGARGAISLGKKMFSTKAESSQDKMERIRSTMALASLYYYAADSAGTRMKQASIWRKPLWLVRSFIALFFAWDYCDKAVALSKKQGYVLTITDLDVIQSVARKCVEFCPHIFSKMKSEFQYCAHQSIKVALKRGGGSKIGQALLLCNESDLLISMHKYEQALDSIRRAWNIAHNLHLGHKKDITEAKQLAGIFRHVSSFAKIALSKGVHTFRKHSEIIVEKSTQLAQLYAESSEDQKVKLGSITPVTA